MSEAEFTLVEPFPRRMLPLRAATLVAALWFVWTVVSILCAAPQISALNLGDTDNYMHLVQWRDFLAGQGWFDLSQHRFVGPDGGDMHFSRIPDALMTVLFALLAPAIGAAPAEQAVLLIYPPLLLLAFLGALCAAAKEIAGAPAAIAATILTFLSSPVIQQFAPGRIDHHGLALVFSMAAFCATVFSIRHARVAAAAAVFSIFATAVSLETAPVFAGVFLFIAGRWIVMGAAAPLAAFGATAAIAGPLTLLATLGLAGFSDGRCDAFAAPAMAAVTGAGIIAVGLSRLRVANWRRRIAAALPAAALLGGGLILTYPSCLSGPYAGVDPLVKEVWLAAVGEAGSPLRLVATDPGLLFALYGSPIAALIVGFFVHNRVEPGARAGLAASLTLLALTAMLLAIAIRGAVIAAAFAIPPAAIFLREAWRPVTLRPPRHLARFLAIFMLVAPSTYGALGNEMRRIRSPDLALAAPGADACDSAAAIRTLQSIEPSLIFSPIDLGPSILAQTGHSVTAAPYHRNSRSMRRTIEFFTADEAAARAVFERSGADFLVFCPSSIEARAYEMRAPSGLAARLAAGEPPPWLEMQIPPSESALGVWRLAK